MKGPEWLAVVDLTKGTAVAQRVAVADTFWPRLTGLLGRKGLDLSEGLLIQPCSSIHTFFMRFAIDAVFIGKDRRVLRVYNSLAPWRATLPIPGAWAVLELPSGAAADAGVAPGDELELCPSQ